MQQEAEDAVRRAVGEPAQAVVRIAQQTEQALNRIVEESERAMQHLMETPEEILRRVVGESAEKLNDAVRGMEEALQCELISVEEVAENVSRVCEETLVDGLKSAERSLVCMAVNFEGILVNAEGVAVVAQQFIDSVSGESERLLVEMLMECDVLVKNGNVSGLEVLREATGVAEGVMQEVGRISEAALREMTSMLDGMMAEEMSRSPLAMVEAAGRWCEEMVNNTMASATAVVLGGEGRGMGENREVGVKMMLGACADGMEKMMKVTGEAISTVVMGMGEDVKANARVVMNDVRELCETSLVNLEAVCECIEEGEGDVEEDLMNVRQMIDSSLRDVWQASENVLHELGSE
jgi:hypothetical protein